MTFSSIIGLSGVDPRAGTIGAATDFPTSGQALTAKTQFLITASVTDNDSTRTNTGQSFVSGDYIVWNGTNWTKFGNTASSVFRGNYDASVNLFPSTGGSGTAGAILAGDFWVISVAGTLGGESVSVGTLLYALQNTPGQTASNWQTVNGDFVVGATSSTDNAITRFDGVTGKLIQTSLSSIDDSGNISTPSLKLQGATSGTISFSVPAVAGTNSVVFPAGSTDFSATGGASRFIKQASAGSALTVTQVADADLSITDISTNNSSTSAHGFLPKLSNVATQFMNGQGNWTTPAGIAASYLSQAFSATTTATVTHNFGAYPVVDVIDNTGAVLIPLSIIHSSINEFVVTLSVSTTGNVLASLGSPQLSTYLSTSSNYTTVAADRYIEVTASAKTITLITAVGRVGKEYTIINSSGGDTTVDTTSSQTINGVLTQIIPSGSSMTVVGNGSNWFIT